MTKFTFSRPSLETLWHKTVGILFLVKLCVSRQCTHIKSKVSFITARFSYLYNQGHLNSTKIHLYNVLFILKSKAFLVCILKLDKVQLYMVKQSWPIFKVHTSVLVRLLQPLGWHRSDILLWMFVWASLLTSEISFYHPTNISFFIVYQIINDTESKVMSY